MATVERRRRSAGIAAIAALLLGAFAIAAWIVQPMRGGTAWEPLVQPWLGLLAVVLGATAVGLALAGPRRRFGAGAVGLTGALLAVAPMVDSEPRQYVGAFDASNGSDRWTVAATATVATADGVVVVQAEDGLRGVDAVTGDDRWRIPLPAGPGAAPETDLAGRTDGSLAVAIDEGRVRALDLTSGGWSWEVTPPAGSAFFDAGVGGGVVAALGHDDMQYELVLIESATGSVTIDVPLRACLPEGMAPSPGQPSQGCPEQTRLLVVGDGAVVVRDPLVQQMTVFDAGTGVQRWQAPLPDATLVGPVGGVLVEVEPREVVGVDVLTGAERWRLDVQGFAVAAPPDLVVILAVDPVGTSNPVGTVAMSNPVGTAGLRVIAVEAVNGAERWSVRLEGSPTWAGANMVGAGAPGVAVAVGPEVMLLDRATGVTQWATSVPVSSASPRYPTDGSLSGVVVGETVVALTRFPATVRQPDG